MSTTGGTEQPSFYKDELEREQIATLIRDRLLTANEIVEGLWHGQVPVRRNAAKGAQLIVDLPDPGEVMLRIASKDIDEQVRNYIVSALAMGTGSTSTAVPLLFDALLDKSEDIRETARQGLERRLTQKPGEVVPYHVNALGDVRAVVGAIAGKQLTQADSSVSVIHLVPKLAEDDPGLRRAAYDVLDRLKWQAVGPLIEALREPRARDLAARLLSGLGQVEVKYLQQLEALEANAKSSGDVALAQTVERVRSEIVRVVEPPRTAPLDIPVPGFFQGVLAPEDIGEFDVSGLKLDELLHALRDGRAFVRTNAVALLGTGKVDEAHASEVASDKVVSRMSVVLRDGDANVRAAAAGALAAFAGGASARAVVGALSDVNPDVRAAAADSLYRMGADGLAAAFDAIDVKTSEQARDAIANVAARHGVSVVQVLADVIVRGAGTTSIARATAASALGALGKAAEDGIAALLSGLGDSAEEVRLACAQALGFVGVNDDAILVALQRCLRDPVPTVRRAAALAASRITGKPLDDRSAAEPQPLPIPGFETEVLSAEAIASARGSVELSAFVKALRDGRDVVKRNAAAAIGTFGESGQGGAQPLAVLLRDGNVDVRRAAVNGFIGLGKAALPAVWFLTAALSDPDPEVKDGVIEALVNLHPEDADYLIEALRTDTDVAKKGIFLVWLRLAGAGVRDLASATKNGSALIRMNACWALEMLAAKGAAETLGDLEARLGDPNNAVRGAAQAAIDAIQGGKVKPPVVLEADPVLIPGFEARILDAEAIGAGLDQTTIDRMVRALRDGRAHVRANAATALGLFGDAASVGPLAFTARDSAIEVRRASAVALGKLGSPEAAALLVTMLEDKLEVVREAAKQALNGLGPASLAALTDALARPAVLLQFTAIAKTDFADEAAAALRGALGHESPLIRQGALRSLRVIGRERAERAKAEVDRLLGDSDDGIRADARATLDHIAGKDVAPPAAPPLPIPPEMTTEELGEGALREIGKNLNVDILLKAVQDGRELVRINAAQALGFVPNPPKRVGPALAIVLRDADPKVRAAAVAGLESMAPKDAAPAAFWLTVSLNEPDQELKRRIIDVLAKLHDEAPDALVEALRLDPDIAPTTIVPVFAVIGGPGIETLAKALKAPSGLIRINAAMALEALAKKGADRAMDDLEAALGDPIKRVRVQAALAIDAIQGGRPKPPKVLEVDPVGIPGFEDSLLDADTLGAALDQVNGGAERLARALTDGRPWVRTNAASALGLLGSQANGQFPKLAVAAKDESLETRRAALTSMAQIDSGRAAPILVASLGDRSPVVRKAASAALTGMGEGAFPALALGLATDSEVALGELVKLIGALGPNAVQALVDGLGPGTQELHAGALQALLAFDRTQLEPHRDAVAALLQTAPPAVKAWVVNVLDRADGKDTAPAALEATPLPLPDFDTKPYSREQLEVRAEDLRLDLLKHFIQDGRAIVRANAATGLGVLATAESQTVGPLCLALKDASEEVRLAAAQALATMKPRRDVAYDLVVALNDASPRVVKAVEKAVANYGEFAIDALMYALDDEPELVARTVLPMLGAQGAKAIDALVLAFGYDSPLVRQNAATALRFMEKDEAKAARAALSLHRYDEVRNVRLAVRETLAWLDGIEGPVDFAEALPLPSDAFATDSLTHPMLREQLAQTDSAWLTKATIDGRRKVRENAVRGHYTLGVFHDHLRIRLKDDVEDVQHATAETLRDLGPLALPAAAALVEALADNDPALTTPAAEALVKLGTAALPAIIAGLWVPPDVAKRAAIPVLVEMGPVATPTVIEALYHPSQLVQLNALEALRLLYGKDPKGCEKGMKRVEELTRASLPAIIKAAQKCLFRLEGRTPAEFRKEPVPMPIVGFDVGTLAIDVIKPNVDKLETPFMISAMADGRDVVRENAARSAGFLPKAANDLFTSLSICLKDARAEVQAAAAEALGTLKSLDSQAIPAVTFALRDTDKPGGTKARQAMLQALDAFGPKRCAEELVKHLVGREDWMLKTIGKVAARMSEVFVPALIKVAKDPEESLIARENAVAILGDLGAKSRGVTKELLSLLPEQQGMLSSKAALALGRVSPYDKVVIAAMQKHAELDPRPSVVGEIIQAVKIIKRKQAVAARA